MMTSARSFQRLACLCSTVAFLTARVAAQQTAESSAAETGFPLGEEENDFGARLQKAIVERELSTKGFSGTHSHPGFFSDKGVLQDVCVRPRRLKSLSLVCSC